MKTNRLIYLLAACFLCGLLILQIGCSKVADEPEENPFSAALSENTKVIDPTDWQDSFVSLDSSDYTITFNNSIDAMNLKAGDIMVSEAGDGFLRKVTSIQLEEDMLLVMTENADLEDAIENGEFVIEQPLTISDVKSFDYHYEGISLNPSCMKQLDNTNFTFDISAVLYDADGVENGTWDQIRLEGEFSCSWDIYMTVTIKWFKLKKVRIGFEASENLDLALIAGLEYNFEKSVNLMTVNFNSITVYVAGCPVVVTPVLEINAGVDGYANANITTSISQELSFDAGIEYNRGSGWSTDKTFDKSFNYSPPQLNLNAGAEVYLEPELAVKVYGVRGPYVTTRIYGKLEADLLQSPWWTLSGGLKLSAGAKVKKFGKTFFDKHYDGLISYEELIAQSSVPPPIVISLTTADISNITLTSAIGGGNVLSEGESAVTTRGVCWSTSQNPTIADNKTMDGSGLGAFTSNITDLSLNTIYFVRAYASNSDSVAYGSEKSFYTGPAAWFPFDGDFNDQSGNNYNGTNMNATWTTDRDGNSDQALLFNGNSSGVELSNGYPPVFNGSLTVSMWVYFNDDSRAVLMGSYNNSHNVNFEKHTSNRLRIYWNSGQRNFLTSNNVVSQNTWHFVTFVRDKELDKFIIYVDGNEVANMSDTGSDVSPTGPFRIGRDSRTGSTVTNGKIDDVRIYSRALSAEEILELFNY